MKGIKGKTALITGASSGLGQAIAVKFAQEGANVAINFHRSEKGARKTQEMVDDHHVRSLIIQADVARETEVEAMFSKTIEELGYIDFLVNNAAIQIKGPSHEIPVEEFDKVIATNLRGTFLCCRLAIRHFISREVKGAIVNITSAHEIIPKPGFIGYSASKGALRTFTQTLALEYAHKGIRVNNIAPGAMLTRMNEQWIHDPRRRVEIEKHVPLGYAAPPSEIAPAVVFMCSEDASYITGATLYVDGGVSLYPEERENLFS